jgi:hypothetical protein
MPKRKHRKIPEDAGWVNVGDLGAHYGKDSKTIYRAVEVGKFPPPNKKIFGQHGWWWPDVRAEMGE